MLAVSGDSYQLQKLVVADALRLWPGPTAAVQPVAQDPGLMLPFGLYSRHELPPELADYELQQQPPMSGP